MDSPRDILQRYWGYPDFRGVQRPIIDRILAGKDTLGLMPTGGGKSLTYQVPGLILEGTCIVITPLIALMNDQVRGLKNHSIPAAALHSGLTGAEQRLVLDNMVLGAYCFVYIAPERLRSPLFLDKLSRTKVSLIAVDEAHCISQWGYDFRPDYLHIVDIRDRLPSVPLLALTATAPPRVLDDIQRLLRFPIGENVIRMSFARKNLSYVVRKTVNKNEELIHILHSVDGAAVVYTRSRRKTAEIAAMLKEKKISATFFHAGLSGTDKAIRQDAWQEDAVRVMVATNAFGMGIDKPDVRVVVHMDVPDSIEEYFQEAGRAGRDGKRAYAVLLHDRYDIRQLHSRITSSFPEREYIRKVYDDLSSFFQIAEGAAIGRTFDFPIEQFCRVFRHNISTLTAALNLLSRAGYIDFTLYDDHASRIIFLVTREELYHIDLDPKDESILNALMRSYGNLFIEYENFEETRLSEKCGLSPDEIYERLKGMTRRRIVNYVPRKNTPKITYTTHRLDRDEVRIMPDIYENRLNLYKEKVEAMVNYFANDNTCRSQYLLRYLGEESQPCGYCDVCVEREKNEIEDDNRSQTEQTKREILNRLNQNHTLSLSALYSEGWKRENIVKAAQELMSEEIIKYDGGNIVLT